MMNSSFPPHFWDEYKTRNILNLADRVRVIRDYDSHLTKPSYQSLATKFDCSSKQIKNIIHNREAILRSYRQGPQKNDDTRSNDIGQKRQEKIQFLGKVMYEFIQRVLYFNCDIDDEKVRQKALQIKECIAVENFQPTNAWLEDFKMTYGIPSFDLISLRNNVSLAEAKSPLLSAIDMIQYVSRQEQQTARRNPKKSDAKRINAKTFPIKTPQFHDDEIEAHLLEPTVVYETHEDDDDDDNISNVEVQVVIEEDDDSNPAKQYNQFKQISSAANKRRHHRPTSPFPDIESLEEAMKHLKALEEYAMLRDNFRAIGLLTQLEQAFKKQQKKK